MIGRPPRSPPFPYTTLFRSLSQGLAAAWILMRGGERNAQRLAAAIRREWDGYPLVREDYIAVVDPQTLEPLKAVRGPALVAVDRKSTRLNSSHLGISYAVFC